MLGSSLNNLHETELSFEDKLAECNWVMTHEFTQQTLKCHFFIYDLSHAFFSPTAFSVHIMFVFFLARSIFSASSVSRGNS